MKLSVVSLYSFGVLLRVISAAVVGYLATSELAVLCARILPLAPLESVLSVMLFSFVLYAGLVMWAFYVRPHWRALTDLGGLWLLAWVFNYGLAGVVA